MDNYGNGFGSRQKVSSNSFACGNNQNSGNILTDTPSTRVARPPGGASTFSFGWDEGRPKKTQPPSPASNDSMSAGCAANQRGSPQPGSAAGMVGAHKGSNGFACGANQNCGNAISDISSTRVNKPPGGSSSLNLGWGDGQVSSPERSHCPAGARSPSSVSVSLSDGYPTSGSSHAPRGNSACSQMHHPASPQMQSSGGHASTRSPTASQTTFGVRPRITSNTFACGADQNCGNFISDTPSTRVNRPPGGTCSLSLAWD